MPKRSQSWDELYESLDKVLMKPHSGSPQNVVKAYDRLWQKLEVMQKCAGLSNQEIFWLQTIARDAYDLGQHDGASNPYC